MSSQLYLRTSNRYSQYTTQKVRLYQGGPKSFRSQQITGEIQAKIVRTVQLASPDIYGVLEGDGLGLSSM